MNYLQSNFFEHAFNTLFNIIITDPPYKHCIHNKLGEEKFHPGEFMEKCYHITETNAGLIVFTNFAMSLDLRLNTHGWKYHTYQIWDKRPTRTWISWTYPLRSCEFILYFTKGSFKFNFKDGTVKPAYKRNSFGGKLKETTPNKNKVSYGMFHEIVEIKNPRNKRHPTEKPREFSDMFKQICGDVKVLDPFCGTGNLIASFTNHLGLDVKNWNE